MTSEQQQRGGVGSSNYQAGRDLHVGLSPEEASKLVKEATADVANSSQHGAAASSPLRGWVRITPTYISKIKPRKDLSDYFDGAAPDWKDVCHSKLKPRSAVATATRAFVAADLEDRSLLLRVGGATGDGKSTALLQIVLNITRKDIFEAIYWRHSPEAVLSEVALAAMSAGKRTVLIVIDKAEATMKQLDIFANTGSPETGTTFHFLLAGRDVDWFAEQDRLKWKLSPASRWAAAMKVLPTISLQRVDAADARVIAENWLTCSLSRPSRLSNSDAREISGKLLEASRASEGRQAFFGAVLSMRYDSERLRSRLSSLLETANYARPSEAGPSLAEFLAVIAAVDLGNIDGLPRDVAARFLDLSETDLRSEVEVPLRREFFFGASSRNYFARHPSISRALLELALDEESTLRVEESCAKLLRDVRSVGQQSGFRPGFGRITDLGRRLIAGNLPIDVFGELSLHLCKTACIVSPRELSAFIALSQCFRTLGRAPDALSDVWIKCAPQTMDRDAWGDYDDHVRGSWRELSTVLGVSEDRRRSYWAASVALSDRLNTSLEPHDVPFGLNVLAFAARRACDEGTVSRASLLNLLSEVEALTRKQGPFREKNGYPTRYVRELGIDPREFGGADSLVDAIMETANAFSASASPLEWADQLQNPSDFSFSGMKDLIRRITR